MSPKNRGVLVTWKTRRVVSTMPACGLRFSTKKSTSRGQRGASNGCLRAAYFQQALSEVEKRIIRSLFVNQNESNTLICVHLCTKDLKRPHTSCASRRTVPSSASAAQVGFTR